MYPRKKDGGFTLIELMIVIAVIGILAIVLIPKMAGIKDTAKEVGVTTNVKSVQAYVTANISKWAKNSSTTNIEVIRALFTNFSSKDNSLTNPYSTLTTISTNNNFEPDVSGLAETPTKTDALQLLTSAPASAAIPNGAVVVVIPDDYKTSGITISGYDQNGNKTGEDIVIKD